MNQAVLKQALEALQTARKEMRDWHFEHPAIKEIDASITALRTAIRLADCRECANYIVQSGEGACALPTIITPASCTNGDKFVALSKVVLYKVTK